MARSRGVYNRTYTKERWEKVNPKNKAILDDFIAEYKQQKKSKGTIDGYYSDLRIVLIKIMLDFDNQCILDLNKKDFRNISLWLSDESDLSANRVNRMKSAMNSMLAFCEEDDSYNYEVNQSKKVKGLPRERVKTNEDNFFFTYDEFIKVRNKLVEQGDLQTAVLWSISFDSAGRRNEVFQVQKQGLLDGNKTNIVRGKRGKLFSLIYLDDTKGLIQKYLEQRGDDNIDSLWIKGSGENKELVDSAALYVRIVKCSKILSEIRGEETNIFPHSIRHSRIECLACGDDPRLLDENGENRKYSLDEIQVFVHHSDVSTTQSYTKDHTDEKIDDMFGLNK